MDELLEEVDYTRHARYWEEAFNGVVMRMALLALGAGGDGVGQHQRSAVSLSWRSVRLHAQSGPTR